MQRDKLPYPWHPDEPRGQPRLAYLNRFCRDVEVNGLKFAANKPEAAVQGEM